MLDEANVVVTFIDNVIKKLVRIGVKLLALLISSQVGIN